MRKPIIAGNWKMNLNSNQALEFIDELSKVQLNQDVETIICPPAIHLYPLKEKAKAKGISLGAQNMYYEEAGAFTGEISPEMLKNIGIDYVILGHSERRTIFKECDLMIEKKVEAAFKFGVKPILCVGESLEEREAGKAEEKVASQLTSALEKLDKNCAQDLVVAYEPIWAIGTGKTASSQDAKDMVNFIRERLAEIFGKEIADKIRILYGGSVKPSNIKELMEGGVIDGALVGGASLKVDSFSDLVNF